jgi:hypothetical protein
VFTQNVILLGRERRAPFVVALPDGIVHGSSVAVCETWGTVVPSKSIRRSP